MALRPTGGKLFVDGINMSSRLLSVEFDSRAMSHEYTLDGGENPMRVYNGAREDSGALVFLYDPELINIEPGDEVETMYAVGPESGAPTRRLARHGIWQHTHSHPGGGLQEVVIPIGEGEDGWDTASKLIVCNEGRSAMSLMGGTLNFTLSGIMDLADSFTGSALGYTGALYRNVIVTVRVYYGNSFWDADSVSFTLRGRYTEGGAALPLLVFSDDVVNAGAHNISEAVFSIGTDTGDDASLIGRFVELGVQFGSTHMGMSYIEDFAATINIEPK